MYWLDLLKIYLLEFKKIINIDYNLKKYILPIEFENIFIYVTIKYYLHFFKLEFKLIICILE